MVKSPHPVDIQVGRTVCSLRALRGVTQLELANRINILKATIGEYDRVVRILRSDMGFNFSKAFAQKMLNAYLNERGYLHPDASLRNIPWMVGYLSFSKNFVNQALKEDGEDYSRLKKAITENIPAAVVTEEGRVTKEFVGYNLQGFFTDYKRVKTSDDTFRETLKFIITTGRQQNAHKFTYVKCISIAVLILLGLSIQSSQAAPPKTVTVLDAKTSNLLKFIGTLEAPGGYNSYSYYAAAPPPKPLTQMTIAEVLAWQDRIDARSKSEAAGRFQIMEDTLRPLVRNHGIDTKQLFDVNMQNRLAVILLKRRGWDPKSPNHTAMANSLAKEWAALPVVTGPNKGKSYYRNTKGARNRAQTTPEIFLDVLKNGSKATAVLKAVKLSRSYRRVTSIKNRSVTIESITRVKRIKTRKVKGGDIAQSKVIVFNKDPFQLD